MVGFFPGTCKNRSSRTGEILFMMLNPNCIPLNRIVINRRYVKIMQYMLGLMKFLYMDICKSSSSPTRINIVIILSTIIKKNHLSPTPLCTLCLRVPLTPYCIKLTTPTPPPPPPPQTTNYCPPH